jgi:hypothetical protein
MRESGVRFLLSLMHQDEMDFEIDRRRHCLLLCMEVFRSEMEYAIPSGNGAVLSKLKKTGPFLNIDLDRTTVF